MTKPANIKALETGSGVSWEEWLAILEPHQELDHTAMAEVVVAKIREVGTSASPEWWAQGVTVAYEQHIGRRKPGQRSDGKYSTTVSKTFPGDMDAALALWVQTVSKLQDFNGVALSGEPRISHTDKWRYWRANLADDTTLTVNIQTKPNGTKSSLAINHDNLATAEDVQRWKEFWKGFEG